MARLLFLSALVATLALTLEAGTDATLAADVPVAHAIQGIRAPGLDTAVQAFNAIGGSAGAALLTLGIAAGVAWRRHLSDALLLLLTPLARGANAVLKDIVRSPRPTPNEVHVTDPSSGYGFPSGHTAGMVVLCAVIAYIALRHIGRRGLRWAVIGGAALLALAVGFSRVYSGAHWPSDVLGGYLWGALFALAIVAVWRRLCARFARNAPADAT